MVNYFIYAKDFSGSTGGVEFYHLKGMQSLKQFKSDVAKIQKEVLEAGESTESKVIYLHWGDECYEVDEETSEIAYIEQESGNMGTEPDTIVAWIQRNYNICGENNKIKLLYIVTDGMIDSFSVNKCFELNEKMHYESVVFHAFNECMDDIDLSVAASFLKGRCMIHRNNELFDDTDISEEFDYDTINLNNFETERDNLKSYIRLKYINKFKHNVTALQEIDKLKKLRDRLFAELSSASQKSQINLETRDRNVFLREFVKTDWYKNLNAPAYDKKVEIEKSISTLINYIVSDTKSYSFDALKFETTFNANFEEEPIVDVNFASEQEIEFPDIILDDEKGIPVILLTELNLLDKIIFHTTKETDEWNVRDAVSPASFNKFKSAMECPLFLLKDSDISESIGYFYTLNVYKQLLTNTNKTEPRTRRPFHGGLVLIDTDEFDKYNDYILSATYFNSKIVQYNIALFYFVLWKNCENKEWMDRNVVEQFKKYVMRRISATTCKIGLSSLPLDPRIKTSLTTALWYCVELSSHIFKDDAQNFMYERLRMHYGITHGMIEILEYFNYDLDLKFIRNRRDLIRHVMILKKIPTHIDKVYYLLQRIFKSINGFLVCEIEKPFNLQKLNYLELNHKDMLNDDVVMKEIHLNDFVHLMHLKDCKRTFEICEKTFRPFFTIDENTSFYTELFKTTKKVVINNDDDHKKIKITYDEIDCLELDKILSTNNLFIKCVEDTGKYPTFPEYIEYISKKKKYHGDLVTIFPFNFYTDAEGVYSQYENIMKTVDVNTFIKASKKYAKRSERIKAEEIVKFDNEEEINKFISGEESKVKLKAPVLLVSNTTNSSAQESQSEPEPRPMPIRRRRWVPPRRHRSGWKANRVRRTLGSILSARPP